jgi:hypothetical protein
MSAVRHNQGTTMPNMDTIKTAAIELLNDPHRKFGRGVSHTLDNVVGAALTLASEGAPLNRDDFERARSQIVQSIREGRAC